MRDDIKYIINLIRSNKLIIAICLVLSLVSSSTIVCSSSIPVVAQEIPTYEFYDIGEGDKIYTFADLVQLYENNSITYKRKMMDYQIQALGFEIARENHTSINQQYYEIVDDIEKLRQTRQVLGTYREILIEELATVVTGSAISIKQDDVITMEEDSSLEEVEGDSSSEEEVTEDQEDNYDIEALIKEIDEQIAIIDNQIAQYQMNLSSLSGSLMEAKISKDISEFYGSQQKLLEEYAKKQITYNLLKQSYSAIINREQYLYSKSYHKYLELKDMADKIKYNVGILNQEALDTNKLDLLKNELTMFEYLQEYDSQVAKIKMETKMEEDSRLQLNLITETKVYDIEATRDMFLENYPQWYEIKNYIRTYENYLKTGTRSYATYEQTKLRIVSYQLQLEELEGNVEYYVEDSIKKYNLAIQYNDLIYKENQTKIDLYEIMLKKKEKGRASLIEVEQAFLDKEAANAKFVQSCCEIVLWQYILDHGIYGTTP